MKLKDVKGDDKFKRNDTNGKLSKTRQQRKMEVL